MSHFTMIVFGTEIDEQLFPFNEQSEEPEHKSFVSTEAEDMSKYLTKTLKVITLPDGTTTNKYDEKYRVVEGGFSSSSYVYPEGHSIEEKKFCEYFKTFEQYMESWCSSTRDEETGEYGYWCNPNGKWDWYQIGGRWSGFFKLKNGCLGKVGQSGSFKNEPRAGWADSARIKDIDFEYMREDVRQEANKQYDELEKVLQGRSLVSWKEMIKDCKDDELEAASIVYNEMQVIKDLKAANIDPWGDYVEEFKNSRAEYVKSCVDSVGVTFGFVLESKWFEKGQMGGFGMSYNEQDQDTWNEAYWKMVGSLDPDTLMTVVDCHI